jgi:hypothetical protein
MSRCQSHFQQGRCFYKPGSLRKRNIGKLSLRVSCEPPDWQMDSATLACGALGKDLSAVEELTFDLDVDETPSNWENALDDMLGHELLLPFIDVKKLHTGPPLPFELSQALNSVPGELAMELLPELQELKVPLEMACAKKAFSPFVETREYVGRPVALLAPHILHPEREAPRVDPPPSSPPPQITEKTTPAPVLSEPSLVPHHQLATTTDGSQARAPRFYMYPLLVSYNRLSHAPILYDIASTPSARSVIDRTMHIPFPAAALEQPTTEPPILASSRLVLRSSKLPWVVVVGENRKVLTSPNLRTPALTNLDVLYAVHTTLMTCVTPEEWHCSGRAHARSAAFPRRTRNVVRVWAAVGRMAFGGWIGWAVKRIWSASRLTRVTKRARTLVGSCLTRIYAIPPFSHKNHSRILSPCDPVTMHPFKYHLLSLIPIYFCARLPGLSIFSVFL